MLRGEKWHYGIKKSFHLKLQNVEKGKIKKNKVQQTRKLSIL